MAYIEYNPRAAAHRNLVVPWRCLNDACGHEFYASLQGSTSDWAWCPECRASTRVVCALESSFSCDSVTDSEALHDTPIVV